MIVTRKVDILNLDSLSSDFILQKQKERSYAYRKMWKNQHLLDDYNFRQTIQNKYNLQAYEYQCIKIDVETQAKQVKTIKLNTQAKIIEIKKTIEEIKSKPQTKWTVKKLIELYNTLKAKEKSLTRDITFGGKDNLKIISRLFNDKANHGIEILDTREIYQAFRLQFIHIIGEAPYKGNRHIEFHLDENYVIYRPNKNIKIRIEIQVNKNYTKELQQLSELIRTKPIPISFQLSTTEIHFSYDLEKLTDTQFNKKEFFKDRSIQLLNNPEISKDSLKQIFKNHKKIQQDKLLSGKLINRYCSIDLNPEFIGISILEKQFNNSIKILDTFCYDLREITKKSGLSVNDPKSIYLTNKRKHEISCIYKSIVKKCNHFKVAFFVMEDLDFKSNVADEFSKEFNRKTKNIWNRSLQTHLIKKNCCINKIQLITVNPCYSSFIGNIQYNYFDPVNAAIEIGRRGIFKYQKGTFYPKLTSTIIDTMICRFNINTTGDVQFFKDCKTWVELFRLSKKTRLKYRRQLEDTKFNCFSKDHIKSGVLLYTFN